ncbi:hypothetical protein EV382_3788 [Micromonospora violae]|uniref:DUF3592 domain-containing protein n=1 Tax=Micromonospora violae TaxID=1278207 RepID=A0A4Q7UGR2_9ACTN|nr:hypothetical protein [Micromonospora violae]RZT80537.1 hypothetical protein EV382_3788 [Micromonospora violae]
MRTRGRRRFINRLGAWYLLVFTLTGAIGALAATTRIRADEVVVPGTVVWCAALVVAGLVASPPPRMIMLSVAWLLSSLLMFVAAGSLWAAVLTLRGERVVATVIDVRDGSEEGRHLYYTLADQYDRRIPGELGMWPGSSIGASNNPEGTVGQRVVVVRDPEGLVDPRSPEEVATGPGNFALLPVVFVVLAVLCMLAGRPRPEDDTPQPVGQPYATDPQPTWGSAVKRQARGVRGLTGLPGGRSGVPGRVHAGFGYAGFPRSHRARLRA